ncbi:hypothetical protein [Nocardia inohanensis]|uniref:hypothetical protein n=1 Tax=Nocardia inohanensis TaxID=209246 RepID=UPI00082FE7F3|nr:hypothetical protein [Nocardia inohanensis]
MWSVVLLVAAAFDLGCLVYLLRSPGSDSMRTAVLVVVGLGLAYDAAVFGSGTLVGEGAALHAASIGRFLGHAVCTPLLLLWAADALPGRPVRRCWAAVAAGALVVWGLADLSGLRLVPKHFADTLRYSAESPSGPPIPALLVTAALLVVGLSRWRAGDGPWLTAGVLALVLASGAAIACPPLGNLGESILLAALVTHGAAGLLRYVIMSR